MLKRNIAELRVKLRTDINFSDGEREVIKGTIDFFTKTLPELERLEQEFKKASKEDKKDIKLEYKEKIKE